MTRRGIEADAKQKRDEDRDSKRDIEWVKEFVR